jgi:hypothetical protein
MKSVNAQLKSEAALARAHFEEGLRRLQAEHAEKLARLFDDMIRRSTDAVISICLHSSRDQAKP